MAELDIRYATALLELSVEKGALDETLKQAAFLRDTLSGDDCMHVIVHPHISSTEKIAFLRTAFGGHVQDHLFGFLCLMVEKNREAFLASVLTQFVEMIRKHQRKTTARVISAVELQASQISSLQTMLSKKLNKQVDVAVVVDPSVIGGFYIHVDGYLIDETVKTKLHDMKVHIKKECGA